MNIVVIADENYASQSAATLISFLENNRNERHDIYYITTGISEQSRLNIEGLCKKNNAFFHYILFEEKALSPYDGIGHWSKYTFMKLFIPQLLPDEVKKVLYLDVDMLILDSLEEVYNIVLGDNALAAVEDVPYNKSCCKRCGLGINSVYVNSGFMLLNLSAWRKEWNANSFNRFVDDHRGKMTINDQDVINSVFYGKIMPLEWRYNVTSFFFGLSSAIWKLYPKKMYKKARSNPAVIHFTNSNKPWKDSCVHLYAKKWRSALNRTPFGKIEYKTSIKVCVKLCVYEIVDFIRIRF